MYITYPLLDVSIVSTIVEFSARRFRLRLTFCIENMWRIYGMLIIILGVRIEYVRGVGGQNWPNAAILFRECY